ncbi:MAG: hypothetical protein AAGE43_16210 [Pseudomonadota bacterium]
MSRTFKVPGRKQRGRSSVTRTRSRFSAVGAALILAGCSNVSPTQTDIDTAGTEDERMRATFERQCIASGVQPGTPMLIKCVEDLLDIHSEPAN